MFLYLADMYQKTMVPEVDPCMNFYGHACGNYPNVREIQPHREFHIPAFDRAEAVEYIILGKKTTFVSGFYLV